MIGKFAWRLIYSAFFSLWIWLISFDLRPQILPVALVAWVVRQVINLPVVLIMRPFPSVYYLDFWGGPYCEYAAPYAFYGHLESAVLAYMIFFYLAEAISTRLGGASLYQKTAAHLADWRFVRYFRGNPVFDFARWVVVANLIAGGVWMLYARPLPGDYSRAAIVLREMLDAPIVVASGLLPDAIQKVSLVSPHTVEAELWAELPLRLLLGTLVYSGIVFVLLRMARQLGLAPHWNLVLGKLDKLLAVAFTSSRPHWKPFGLKVVVALAVSITIQVTKDLPALLPAGPLITLIGDILALPVRGFWQSLPAGLSVQASSLAADPYYQIAKGTTAYLVLFLAVRAIWIFVSEKLGDLAKPSISSAEDRQLDRPSLWFARPLAVGLTLAYVLAGVTWYIKTSPVPSSTYWFVMDVIRWLNLPIMMVNQVLPTDLRGVDLWLADWHRPTREHLLQHMVVATAVYTFIFWSAATGKIWWHGAWKRSRRARGTGPFSGNDGDLPEPNRASL